MAALREARARGRKVLAIVNVVGSSIARESDDVIYTWAGPEIAVASTKAFTAQVTLLSVLAIYFAEILGSASNERINTLKTEILSLPSKIEQILELSEEVKSFAHKVYTE